MNGTTPIGSYFGGEGVGEFPNRFGIYTAFCLRPGYFEKYNALFQKPPPDIQEALGSNLG